MDSEPSTSAGGSIHRAPATPMWSTASTRRSVRARAVCSAASTGPIPQQKVSASRTNASSRSVAATTSTARKLAKQPLSAADLAANLPGGILRGMHVHVQQVLAEILDHGCRHLRLAGLAVLARRAKRDEDVARLAHRAEMDVRLKRRAAQVREGQLPRQRLAA